MKNGDWKIFFSFSEDQLPGAGSSLDSLRSPGANVKTEVPKHLFPPTGRVVHGNTHEFQSTLKKFEKEQHGGTHQ